MAEFNADGEVPFKEGFKHGSGLSLQELDRQVDALEQVGNLVCQLLQRTSPSQRKRILSGTAYIIGVASTQWTNPDGTPGYTESPDYFASVGDDQFIVRRNKIQNRYEGMEEYNLVKGNHITSMIVWDHPGTPPLVQRVSSPEDLQDALDTAHENRKTDALLAREWLVKTRRFLLQALSNL